MIVPNNFDELLWPGLNTIFQAGQDDWPEEYSQFMDVQTSSKSREEDQGITGLGLLQDKAIGGSISYEDPNQTYKKTYTMSTKGLGFAVARELLEDDQYGKIAGMPKALSRAVRHTVEIDCQNLLNNAFDSGYTGGDGVELCSAVHPTYGGGGTYRNELETSADLDPTSFEQMLIDISTQFIDDKGLTARVMPQKLLIHASNMYMARQILQSAQMPGTANNEMNPGQNVLPGGFVILHEVTDTDAFFITTDQPNGLKMWWRRRPEFTRDNVFDSENAKFKVTLRKDQGWTDPRCIFGSPGQ